MAAKQNLDALRGTGASASPGGAIKPKPMQQDAEDRSAADKDRLEVLEREIELRNETVELMVRQAQEQEAIAAQITGPMTDSMQTFFQQMADGYKSLADIGEAVAKSIAKSFIGMYAQVLEQQAAMAFAEAMGSSLNPLTAFAAPGMFARSALLATAAGGLRAVAANMADGGMVKSRPGGTVVRLGERGEDEAVVPARMMDGFGGGVKVGTVALNYYGVKDARDAMASGRAEQAGHQILTRLDEEQRRQGIGKRRGGR